VKKIFKFVLFQLQKILLIISYTFFSFFIKRVPDLWIVGVEEVAAYVQNIGKMLEPSFTVSFSKNKFYNFQYSFSLPSRILLTKLFLNLYSPILLGYLMNKSDRFFYVWHTGFLIDGCDGRKFEFSFLKKKKKTVCCLFVGNDIRSPKLALESARNMDLEITASYYDLVAPYRLKESYEKHKKLIASSADEFADIVFNAPIDQISYLKKPTYPCFYVYPDEAFVRRDAKFLDLSIIKILHAPSSPIVKGSQIVRAAIKKLRVEGYQFIYTELIGIPNERVLELLRESHIVLNEFYAFVPGFFGIEAMASHCALVTSGDPHIETSLPLDAEGAWMITKYWQVYDNLKFLLDNPEKVKLYADAGYEWTKKHWTYSVVKKKLLQIIGENSNFYGC